MFLYPVHHPIVGLLGHRDELLKLIESAFLATILVRGNEITISGDPGETRRVAILFEELIGLLDKGQTLTEESIRHSIGMIKSGDALPRDVLTDSVFSHRGE